MIFGGTNKTQKQHHDDAARSDGSDAHQNPPTSPITLMKAKDFMVGWRRRDDLQCAFETEAARNHDQQQSHRDLMKSFTPARGVRADAPAVARRERAGILRPPWPGRLFAALSL